MALVAFVGHTLHTRMRRKGGSDGARLGPRPLAGSGRKLEDGAQRMPARVCGELLMLTFAAAPMGVMQRPKVWFPAGRSLVQRPKGAAMLAWWRSNEWLGRRHGALRRRLLASPQ